MSEAYRDKLFSICERLVQTSLKIAEQCKLTVTKQGFVHPKLLALTLLIGTLRTRTSFTVTRIATDYNDYVRPPVLPDVVTMNHACRDRGDR